MGHDLVVLIRLIDDVLVLIIMERDRLGTGGHGLANAVGTVSVGDEGVAPFFHSGEAVFGIVDIGPFAVVGQVAVFVKGVGLTVHLGQLVGIVVAVVRGGRDAVLGHFLRQPVPHGIVGVFRDGAIGSGFLNQLFQLIISIGRGSFGIIT